MTKKVLLTGSTGALGQVLARRFAVSSEFIVSAPTRNQGDLSLDFRDKHQIELAIERCRPDLIIHLAATFSADFDEAFSINVTASRRILETVEASGYPVRVVLIGSAAEYGMVTPDENPIREDHVLRPVSTYGMTKAWQSELAYLYAARGVDVVVARIFNLTGPFLSERLFVGRLQRQIDEIHRGDRSLIEVGPLSAVRDYLSTDEAAGQLLAIAEHGQRGHVYHVASGKPISMRELLTRELAISGIDPLRVVEGAGFTNRKGYDVPVIYADISRTSDLLNQWEKHAKH